ncbi:polysaccharide biosynthesis protein [Nitrosococcus halophilus Nc 4]|uniref:Polysaccharide biosynthesis protein n=1 Tax=Nitrosococcus halophilus (strain Nc4) TaxID=472759 RepID=D5C0E9_NITHN|nr:flippase [Nitrosococcus halophilus]ADE14475.1 polysaccharide biosynthesis protein [Nitrosococcus halophilus Nc 4]
MNKAAVSVAAFKARFGRIAGLAKSNGLRAQLLRGGIGSIAIKVGHTLLMLATTVVLARVLGAEGFGIYAYAYALVQILGIPAQMGLPILVVREVAAYQANAQWGLLKGILRRAFQAVGVIAIVLALAGGSVAWVFSERFSQEYLTTFAWALLLLPLIALGNLRGAALRGLRKVIQGQLPEHVLRPGGFLLFLGVVWLLFPQRQLTPADAMLMHTVATGMAFGVGGWLLVRSLPWQSKEAAPAYDTRHWLSSALPLSLIAGMQIINSQTDIIMLGLFRDAEEVGVYRVAVQSATLVAFGLQAINMVIAPHFSRLYAAGDMVRLQRVVTASARAILFTALPVVVVLIVFGEPVLRLVFGVEFVSGYAPLAILASGQLVNAAMGSVGFLLNMTGYERNVARGLMIAAVTNIVLNLFLIPLWGMEGAAVATGVTLVLWNILLWQSVRKHLGINSMAFSYNGFKN